jgi:hypothetical protein
MQLHESEAGILKVPPKRETSIDQVAGALLHRSAHRLANSPCPNVVHGFC